jgi:ribosomal protein S18 acetylase RimI-like enzyme
MRAKEAFYFLNYPLPGSSLLDFAILIIPCTHGTRMSCLDLIARHYLLRTTNTLVHPTVDTASSRSSRFTDGDGMSWLFLQRIGGEQSGEGDEIEGEIVEKEAMVQLLQEHCAAPKWSINLEYDTPITPDTSEPQSVQHPEQALRQIDAIKPDATVNKVESMFLDPTNTINETGEASKKAGVGNSGVIEGWKIRDGKTWFAGRFPGRAALVEHEEVWVVIKKGQHTELGNPVEDQEVCGYITTLSDPEPNEEMTGGKMDGRKRVYISSLLIYPPFRRKGLARALLQHVIARAKASLWGPALVCLTVFWDNTGARGMYLAEGFVVTRELWVIRRVG